MKKSFLVFLIIVSLVITGCRKNSTRVATNLDLFSEAFSNEGFIVTDNINSYSGEDYITGAMIAKNSDGDGIEMVIYDTADRASNIQEQQIDSFGLLKGPASIENKDKGVNYYDYVIIANGYYMVSSRVDNTLIFAKVSDSNRDKIEGILDSMRY